MLNAPLHHNAYSRRTRRHQQQAVIELAYVTIWSTLSHPQGESAVLKTYRLSNLDSDAVNRVRFTSFVTHPAANSSEEAMRKVFLLTATKRSR